MPIGEDIPMLIPISIVLVIFLLFLFTLFTGFSDKSDVVRMSQYSLNLGEHLINVKFSEENGITVPDFDDGECHELSDLELTSNYNVKINITNKQDNTWWCWGDLKNSSEVVTNSLPTLIIENGKTIPAMVSVSVGK